MFYDQCLRRGDKARAMAIYKTVFLRRLDEYLGVVDMARPGLSLELIATSGSENYSIPLRLAKRCPHHRTNHDIALALILCRT